MASRVKNISDDLAGRIKSLRRQYNLTQKELAEQLFKSESAVRMWELGKSEPDLETINKLSAIFHVSADYLLGKKKKGIRIPVFGSVAAGYPIEAITDIEDWEEIDEDMAGTGEFAALRIKGDSMEPKISDGDVVVVRLQNTIETGETAIMIINGDEATCKKIKKTPEGVMLISTNPAYEPMFYSNREIAELPVRVWGKVVELRAKFE